MFTVLSSLMAAILGGVVYRWRGSAHSFRPLSQAVFAFPFGAAMLLVSNWITGTIVFALTLCATLTGHAAYADQGRMDIAGQTPADGKRDEWYGKWLRRFNLSPQINDFLGMMLSGLLIALPAFLGLAANHAILGAFIVLLAGAMKSVAYYLGVRGQERDLVKQSTILAEMLTGAFLWGGLVLVVNIIW